MNTSKWRMIFVAVLSLAIFSGVAQAQRGGFGGGGRFGGGGGFHNWNNNNNPPSDWNFNGEWQEMANVTQFSRTQKEALHRLLNELEKARKICEDKLAAAHKAELSAKTDATREVAQKDQAAAKEMSERVETNAKAKVFSEIMKPDQRVAWTAHKLEKYFRHEMRHVSPDLTDDQKAKAKAVFELAAQKTPTVDVEANQKLLDSVREEIKTKVLTEEQRKGLGDTGEPKKKGGEADPARAKSKPPVAPEKPSGLQQKD